MTETKEPDLFGSSAGIATQGQSLEVLCGPSPLFSVILLQWTSVRLSCLSHTGLVSDALDKDVQNQINSVQA